MYEIQAGLVAHACMWFELLYFRQARARTLCRFVREAAVSEAAAAYFHYICVSHCRQLTNCQTWVRKGAALLINFQARILLRVPKQGTQHVFSHTSYRTVVVLLVFFSVHFSAQRAFVYLTWPNASK